MKARARLAAIDEQFRDLQLAAFQARERRVSLAIFHCFHRHPSGNISASHLALCSEDHLPDLTPFRDTFLGWLRRYRLDQCQWLIEALLDSLKDFDQFPELFKDAYHADHNRGGWAVKSEPFRFEFRGFELTGESRERYRGELEQHMKGAIQEHFTRAQQSAEERGLRLARDREPVHFKWLIQYLCLNKTYGDIGLKGRPRATADTVRKAIRRLAEALVIPLPDGPKGRPRGT